MAQSCGPLSYSACAVVAWLCATTTPALASEVVADGGAVPAAETAAAKGTLDLLSNPSGVSVEIDGERLGVTPLVGLALAAGPHQLRLHGPGLKGQEQTVEVAAGQNVRLSFALAPLPAAGYSFLGTGADIPLATAILAGTAAALFGVGLGFGIAANDVQHQAGIDVSSGGVDLGLTRAQALQGKQDAYIANGMYIGAAAALTAAIIVALVTPRHASEVAGPAVEGNEGSVGALPIDGNKQ